MWNVISYQQQLADVTCEMDQSPGALSGRWWLEPWNFMTFHTLGILYWIMIPPDEVHHFSEGCGWNHQPAVVSVVHTKMLRRMDLCLQNWRGLWGGSPPPGFDEALPRSGWNWYSIIFSWTTAGFHTMNISYWDEELWVEWMGSCS